MRKPQTSVITLLFGVFTALVIVFSQVFYFQAPPTGKKESKTEKQETKTSSTDGDQAYISLPSSSMPSSAVAVELNQEGTCLFEILFEEQSENEIAHRFSLSPGKLFNTLFRVIISPNAP